MFVTFFKIKFQFTVQIGERDYSTLTRLMDYSVDAQTLFSLNKIELFRVHFISTGELPMRGFGFTSEERSSRKKRTSKHLQNFKKWIDAANLGERYCQQYS